MVSCKRLLCINLVGYFPTKQNMLQSYAEKGKMILTLHVKGTTIGVEHEKEIHWIAMLPLQKLLLY